MFTLALKAKLPFIGATTDDLANVLPVLSHYAGDRKVTQLPTSNASVGALYLYYTDKMEAVTTDMYKKLVASETQCVVINPTPSPLIFDAGTLPTPTEFVTKFLNSMVTPERVPALLQVLNGLSLKGVQQVCLLTQARTQALLPKDVRRTRMMLGGATPGLYTLDTDYDFYDMPKEVGEWLSLNDSYFLDPATPQKLMPRGLLLAGEPGVGKSLSSMAIARHWDLPLFRLDISTSLNRFLGVSESRIATNLYEIERNAPCVWLLDEVEKLFGGQGGDEGTTIRILSQILWWLQYHKSKVITIMTSNNIAALPKELYRPGRIDRVITIPKLSLNDAKIFAGKVYSSVMGGKLTLSRQNAIRTLLDSGDKGTYSHAEVAGIVYDIIKIKGWTKEDK